MSITSFHLTDSMIAGFFTAQLAIIAAPLGLPRFFAISERRPTVYEVNLEVRAVTKGILIGYLIAVAAMTALVGSFAGPSATWVSSRLVTVGIISSLSTVAFGMLLLVRVPDFKSIVTKIMQAMRKQRKPEAIAVGQLSLLGVAAESEDERNEVLEALLEIAINKVGSQVYKGNSLEGVIRVSVRVITCKPGSTSGTDLQRGLNHLENMKALILRLRKDGPDLRRIREGLWNVASFVLDIATENPKGRYGSVVKKALWALDDEPSAQFALLRRTLNINQPLIWLEIALRLRSQYQAENREQSRARMLGFAAMLRQKGRAEERWVEEQVVSALEGMDIAQALKEAYDRMYERGEFRVADALTLWLEELEEARRPEPVTHGAPLISLSFSLLGGS